VKNSDLRHILAEFNHLSPGQFIVQILIEMGDCIFGQTSIYNEIEVFHIVGLDKIRDDIVHYNVIVKNSGIISKLVADE
jgi:hypothetical protein